VLPLEAIPITGASLRSHDDQAAWTMGRHGTAGLPHQMASTVGGSLSSTSSVAASDGGCHPVQVFPFDPQNARWLRTPKPDSHGTRVTADSDLWVAGLSSSSRSRAIPSSLLPADQTSRLQRRAWHLQRTIRRNCNAESGICNVESGTYRPLEDLGTGHYVVSS
jgi:hypothetical protein